MLTLFECGQVLIGSTCSVECFLQGKHGELESESKGPLGALLS